MTHDQVEAMTLADRIVVMNQGVVEQVGTPAEIYQRPETTYVADFIGAPGLNLMPGIVDPDKGLVFLKDGQQLAYDRSRWPDIGYGPVTIGFRAEAVRLAPHGIAGTFAFAEELGAAKLVHGTFAGHLAIAHVGGDRAFALGEALYFAVEPAEVHLFHAESGHRLAERASQSGQVKPRQPIAVNA